MQQCNYTNQFEWDSSSSCTEFQGKRHYPSSVPSHLQNVDIRDISFITGVGGFLLRYISSGINLAVCWGIQNVTILHSYMVLIEHALLIHAVPGLFS